MTYGSEFPLARQPAGRQIEYRPAGTSSQSPKQGDAEHFCERPLTLQQCEPVEHSSETAEQVMAPLPIPPTMLTE